MADMKRKRDYSAAANALALYRGPQAKPDYKRRKFVPGSSRTGGFYGRYAGPGAELKFHDFTFSHVNVSATGTITPTLNAIAQGTTESQRIGRKCTVKSIHTKFNIKISEEAGQSTPKDGDILRIILYVDKQCNGQTALVTDILERTNYLSFRNLANSGRFNVLSDKMYTLNVNNLTVFSGSGLYSSTEVLRPGSMSKVCTLPIEFSSTTGALSEIRSNNIGVLFISKNGDINYSADWRLRFND